MYLTPGGRKCAVGVHIPDGHPAQGHTGRVVGLSGKYPELAGIAWPEEDLGLNLASILQSIHDTVGSNWSFDMVRHLNATGERKLKETAARFGLEYTPPGDGT